MKEGIPINLPSGKMGPAFQYLIFPRQDYYSIQLDNLKNISNVNILEIEEMIKDFNISRRPTLALEMISYLKFLSGSSFSDETKLRRLCEAALCTEVMCSDVNYHALLEDMSVVKYIYDCLIRVGPKIFQMEKQKQNGTILVVFRCSQSLGIIFVSSHLDLETGEWRRYLHYNSNACAEQEFFQLMQHHPPYDIGKGVFYEEVFTGVVQRNVLLTFSQQSIDTKRSELHYKALDVIDNDDMHDESGLGRRLNLGRINWAASSYGDLQLNHIHCEAALCNASPIIPLKINMDRGTLEMEISFQSVLDKLQKVSSQFHKLHDD